MRLSTIATLLVLLAAAPSAGVAGTLQEVLFNLNGTTFHNTYAVPGLNSSLFNNTTGVGKLTLTFNPGIAGSYFFNAFFDHQVHAPFYNEYGAVSGAPGAGISWQIDEPGFGDGNRLGNIYDNVIANSLDNTNHVPGTLSNFLGLCGGNTAGQPADAACNNDVSMALGFRFILAANESATVTVNASTTAPTSGFYLRQHDPDTPADIYLAGSILIGGGPPPPPIPEPGTWMLVGGGLAAAAIGAMRRKLPRIRTASKYVVKAAAFIVLAFPCLALTPVVKVVPWVPASPGVPHDTYAGKSITLKGTSDVQGPNIQATWDFGDGSPVATFTVTNQDVVEATHVYAGAVGTTWTARLTVRDTNPGGGAATVNYPVIMQANNLSSNVNVAIDEGLWYLHKTMRRTTVGMTTYGDWLAGSGFTISSAYGVTATNIQAFEVNGHLESGSASNPYTDDVARGLRSIFSWLTTSAVSNRTIGFVAPPSCTAPPCTLNPDGNGNGYGAYVNQGNPFYQGGMLIDAIVAAGTPNAVTTTGPAPGGGNPGILGRTYASVVQDLVDGYLYCMYFGSAGGGWRYSCSSFPDNSACQWAAIGIIAAARSFGAVVPQLAIDWNKIWLNSSHNAATGVFGYTDPNPIWGPYATTPSGMVQLAMDGIGRGNSKWDTAESFLRNNFGNAPTNNNVSIKAYYYGLFSFTKAMLLHSPNGVLTPITLLQSSTPGVPPLDWYAAEVSKGDPTDGVARWLVGQQNATGYWYNTLEINTSQQWPFSTGFAVIMLRRTVFTACVTNLQGRGTPAGRAPARVDLTWTGITGASQYTILRGTTLGGPYVSIGNSTTNVFSDSVGLTSGATYYYVLQPVSPGGTAICQSNEARVTIPAAR